MCFAAEEDETGTRKFDFLCVSSRVTAIYLSFEFTALCKQMTCPRTFLHVNDHTHSTCSVGLEEQAKERCKL